MPDYVSVRACNLYTCSKAQKRSVNSLLGDRRKKTKSSPMVAVVRRMYRTRISFHVCVCKLIFPGTLMKKRAYDTREVRAIADGHRRLAPEQHTII